MKSKSLYVLKQIKWINLIDGLTLAIKIYSSWLKKMGKFPVSKNPDMKTRGEISERKLGLV